MFFTEKQKKFGRAFILMKIGLLGYGTVGSGAADCLTLHPRNNVELYRVFDIRDIEKIKDVQVKNISDIIDDESIDIVVEVLGGIEPAHSYVKAALEKGKSVVSANKQMLSHHYEELIKTAKENGAILAFSAAAGGSIPWLINLLRAKRVDSFLSVGGIMNGTTNFILDAMQTDDSCNFGEVLKEAQRLGYAERDPSADIDGIDVKAKLALTCDIAFSAMVEPDEISALGIRYINRRDITYFRTMGRNVRLIGMAEKIGGDVAAFVEPMLFSPEDAEYSVSGAGNLISYSCERMGKHSFAGLGAGKEPTGGAIIGDVYDIDAGVSIFKDAQCFSKLKLRTDLAYHRYYLRTAGDFDRTIVSETLDNDVFITKKISVKDMHEIVNKLINSGVEVFAASIYGDK